MKILTTREKLEMAAKVHEAAEKIRATMTDEQLARLKRERHQGARERARRLRRIAVNLSK